MLYNRQLFTNLSVEIRMMILCTMTAAELINFRRCCKEFNDTFMVNQSTIVRGILKNHCYHTASTLYSIIPAIGPLEFGELKEIARRCDIAEMLASSIAEHHVGQGSGTTIRMAKNIKPYLLSLGHFYEEYRRAVVEYRRLPRRLELFGRGPGLGLEAVILKKNYNAQTEQRICLTYKLLNQILDQKFVDRQDSLPSNDRTRPYPVPVDMFIFGGLELVKDITHRRSHDRLEFIFSHFSKTTAATMPVIREQSLEVAPPSSVVGNRLTISTTIRTWDLSPLRPTFLAVRRIKDKHAFVLVDPTEEMTMTQDFLEYLKSHDGEEPKLVRRKIRGRKGLKK